MSAKTNRRVLVLGGNGMLGHRLAHTLSLLGFDVGTTFRQMPRWHLGPIRAFVNCDGRVPDGFETILAEFAPLVVINCLGVLKQDSISKPAEADAVNARFPKFLSEMCGSRSRFIQISTDCVFSGNTGMYREHDLPDATDAYGISKRQGEAVTNGLVIRTSFIGHELRTQRGLLEWLLQSQQTELPGYRHAYFSGLTTNAFAGVVTKIIADHPGLSGLYHIAGPRISKLQLLTLIRDQYRLPTSIIPDESVRYDRSLDATRFETETGCSPPGWPQMIAEMRDAGRLP